MIEQIANGALPAAENPAPAETPVGQQLRQAREARGFKLEEVAQALKLGRRQIDALESGNWQSLPGPTFIRGFVRNYGRLVGIDVASLMAQLDRVLEKPADNLDMPEAQGTRMPQSGSRISRRDRQVILLGAALLGLAALAYFLLPGALSGLRDRAQSALDAANAPAAAPAEKAAEPLFPPGTTPQQVMNPQAVAPDVATAAPSAPEAAPPAPAAVAPVVPAPAPVPPRAAIVPPAPPAPVAAPVVPPAVVPAPAAKVPPVPPVVPAAPAPVVKPAPAAAAPDAASAKLAASALRLVVDKESWVEVRDRSNRVIFSQRVSAGSEQMLSGSGPLSLVVGYAPGVRLYWQGRTVDLAPHTRGDVARLVLE